VWTVLPAAMTDWSATTNVILHTSQRMYLPSHITYNFSPISFLFSTALFPNATWTASEKRFTRSTDRAKILSLSAAPPLWSPCPWTLHGRPNQRWTYRRWC
jgi:hypothetical protein